jgi:hypothetical protein
MSEDYVKLREDLAKETLRPPCICYDSETFGFLPKEIDGKSVFDIEFEYDQPDCFDDQFYNLVIMYKKNIWIVPSIDFDFN